MAVACISANFGSNLHEWPRKRLGLSILASFFSRFGPELAPSRSTSLWPLCCVCFVASRVRCCACVACMFVGGLRMCMHTVASSVLSPVFVVCCPCCLFSLVFPFCLLSFPVFCLSVSLSLFFFFFFLFLSLSLSFFLSLFCLSQR